MVLENENFGCHLSHVLPRLNLPAAFLCGLVRAVHSGTDLSRNLVLTILLEPLRHFQLIYKNVGAALRT
jgi:hypothetical protein